MARWPVISIAFGSLLVGALAAHAQPVTPPQPTIGLPLPSIGLPLPAIGISPREVVERSQPPSPPGKPPQPGPPPAIVVFGTAPYLWGFDSWQQSARPGTIITEPEPEKVEVLEPDAAIETGRLQLDIRPRDAQIFVNGEFVGTLEDVGGVLELPEGTHRIEIRASRHEALTLDARIVVGRTITYRNALLPVEEGAPTPPVPPAARAPKSGQEPPPPARPSQTFYLIPGCYLGNVPPEQVKLPPDCDLSRMITHKPGQ